MNALFAGGSVPDEPAGGHWWEAQPEHTPHCSTQPPPQQFNPTFAASPSTQPSVAAHARAARSPSNARGLGSVANIMMMKNGVGALHFDEIDPDAPTTDDVQMAIKDEADRLQQRIRREELSASPKPAATKIL